MPGAGLESNPVPKQLLMEPTRTAFRELMVPVRSSLRMSEAGSALGGLMMDAN